jgi:hypothetical protein
MKKNHIVNQSTGNCFCGITPINQLIAFDYENDWFDSTVHPIDNSNYESILCINCMKQFDVDLIDKFEIDAFLIDYHNRLPNGKTAMKFFKRQAAIKRRSINHSKPTIKKPVIKKVESKPAANQSTTKSDKGKARDKRKKDNQSKPTNQSATDNKCKVIAKPKKELIDKPIDDKVIELKDEIKKPLIDLSNGPVTIKTQEVIECMPTDDWTIGDPINDKSIFELVIGDDWKLIRHSKKYNQWKFVNRQTIKGIPKWIDDSEFIDYKEAAELINGGYCE